MFSSFVREAVRSFTPPMALRLTGIVRSKLGMSDFQREWEVPDDPSAAWAANTVGWSHASIAEKQKAGWEEHIASMRRPHAFDGRPDLEANSLAGLRQHNIFMTFGYVLGRCLAGRTKLSVLDWGGGVGTYGVVARDMFPESEIDYTVKEIPELCDAGSALTTEVTFISDETVALTRRYDLVFASSALQYSIDVNGTLARLCDAAEKWLMITRSPFIENSPDFVMVQHPHGHGYKSSLTTWFINQKDLITFVENKGFRLDREFITQSEPYVPHAPEQCRFNGFLFKRA